MDGLAVLVQVRAGFHGGEDVWTRDVLNLGVRPDKLIAKVRLQPEGNCPSGGVDTIPHAIAITKLLT